MKLFEYWLRWKCGHQWYLLIRRGQKIIKDEINCPLCKVSR